MQAQSVEWHHADSSLPLIHRLARVRHSLSHDDISRLAAAAHGFVGADLAALCNEAAMAALRRVIAAGPDALGREEGLVVGLGDFQVAETRVKPSALREVAVEVPQVRAS